MTNIKNYFNKIKYSINYKTKKFLANKVHGVYSVIKVNNVKKFSDSFVGNFLQVIYANLNNASTNFVISSSYFNSTRTYIALQTSGFGNITALSTINAAINDDTFGIVVGSGSTPVSASDKSLVTKISQGTGLNQLVYGVQSSSQGTTISGNNTSFVITRTFQNLSGATINVNEIGLILNCAGNKFLVLRDLFSYAIPNGNTITVNIEFLTVS